MFLMILGCYPALRMDSSPDISHCQPSIGAHPLPISCGKSEEIVRVCGQSHVKLGSWDIIDFHFFPVFASYALNILLNDCYHAAIVR